MRICGWDQFQLSDEGNWFTVGLLKRCKRPCSHRAPARRNSYCRQLPTSQDADLIDAFSHIQPPGPLPLRRIPHRLRRPRQAQRRNVSPRRRPAAGIGPRIRCRHRPPNHAGDATQRAPRRTSKRQSRLLPDNPVSCFRDPNLSGHTPRARFTCPIRVCDLRRSRSVHFASEPLGPRKVTLHVSCSASFRPLVLSSRSWRSWAFAPSASASANSRRRGSVQSTLATSASS